MGPAPTDCPQRRQGGGHCLAWRTMACKVGSWRFNTAVLSPGSVVRILRWRLLMRPSLAGPGLAERLARATRTGRATGAAAAHRAFTSVWVQWCWRGCLPFTVPFRNDEGPFCAWVIEASTADTA